MKISTIYIYIYIYWRCEILLTIWARYYMLETLRILNCTYSKHLEYTVDALFCFILSLPFCFIFYKFFFFILFIYHMNNLLIRSFVMF